MLYVYRNKQNTFSRIAELSTAIFLITFLVLYFFSIDISLKTLSLLVLCNSVAMFILVFTNPTVYHSGSLMMFFLYNVLVNNGFVIAMYLDESYATFQSVTSMAFLQNEYYHEAILIANIVLCVFAISLLFSKQQGMSFDSVTVSTEDKGSVSANIIGVLLVGIATLYTAYMLISHGLWFTGYITSLQALENTAYPHFVVIASLGIAFLIAAGTKRGVHLGILIFGLYSILQFAMGNRGEVFYAAVICFALYSLRFKTIGYRHIIIAGIAVVILIPLIRISRELKIEAYMFNPLSSFLDVLAEEGIEINPFTYIVDYVHRNGHVWGMTYINDFLDFILRRIGYISPFAVEKYVIKEIMPYTGMAFSMIAELYYNFTVVGAAIVYIILGQRIRKFDRLLYGNDLNGIPRVMSSMILVELINLTRNDASTLPIYLTYAIIIICIYKLVKTLFREK